MTSVLKMHGPSAKRVSISHKGENEEQKHNARIERT